MTSWPSDWIVPDWPAPARVRAVITSRNGGVSSGAHGAGAGRQGGGMNLGSRCGDAPADVAGNRARLAAGLPAMPRWLLQVHGRTVLDLDAAPAIGTDFGTDLADDHADDPQADAALTRRAAVVCAVQAADCLPVLFCDRAGSVVAAAHAGWRGLASGVLDATVAALGVPADQVLAWIGPAIGPRCFEVGADVRAAFTDSDAAAAALFVDHAPGKWLADLEGLARRRLQALGVTAIHGGGRCTVSEPRHFYSYRRDGVTGRMAGLIWLE